MMMMMMIFIISSIIIIVFTENPRIEKEQIDLGIFSHKLQVMKNCNAQTKALSVGEVYFHLRHDH